MGTYFTGTLLASPIVRGSSGDTYGTHHSILGVGGYMEVNTLAERNALPVDTVNGINFDGISSGQRRIGMLVYVHAEDTIYQLKVDQATWSGYSSTQRVIALANNTNWVVFASGSEESSGDKIVKSFTQTTHGFDVGDVIGYNGTQFTGVSSLTAGTIEPLGVVSKVIDLNNFNLTFSGYISTTGILDVNSNSLSGGTLYYLSSTDGKITPIEPTGTTEQSKPMLVALAGDTGVVLQYRGLYDETGALTEDLFTGYTATTQLYLDKTVTGATNLGYFTGYTGVQTLPIDHLTNDTYDGDYVSLYNNYYRDDQGYVRIGIPSDGIARRGYLRTTPEPKKSWIWNEYTGDGLSVGWIFVNGDVSSDDVYGTIKTGTTVIQSSIPYTISSWQEGQFYSSGDTVVINTVQGNLTSGDTFVIGGPIYKDKKDKELRIRSIVSETPDTLSVEYDDYFIKLSGTTGVSNVENIGTGVGVYSGTSGSTILLKSLVGDGATTIIDDGDRIIISSEGGGVGSGENVTKKITKTSHGFSVGQVIGWKNGTYTKAIADGTYDGEIIGIVKRVIDINTFDLTQSGFISGLTGLVTDLTYFVSTTTAGNITSTAPTTVGHIRRPILIANSSTSGWVLPYPGYEITPPISGSTGGTGGSIYYTGATPSVCTVGGLNAGATLTGKTVSKILEEILVPELFGTLTAPSTTTSLSPSTTLYEVGCQITTLSVTSSFNRGSINPQYCSASPFRSGFANEYSFSGAQVSGSYTCSGSSVSKDATNYVVSAGTQSWSTSTSYDAGVQPKGSIGTDYCSPLPAGTTNSSSKTITGAYPIFATTSNITTLTKQTLVVMTTSPIQLNMVAESGGDKQKFDIPNAWTGLPLVGVQQYNTVSSQWEYPGGSASSSLVLWDTSSVTQTIQGNTVNYTRYTYNGTDRSGVQIRLIF